MIQNKWFIDLCNLCKEALDEEPKPVPKKRLEILENGDIKLKLSCPKCKKKLEIGDIKHEPHSSYKIPVKCGCGFSDKVNIF